MDLGRQCTSDKSHSEVDGDEEHRIQNAANDDEKHKTKTNELDEDGDKGMCMSSFSDIHEIEKEVDKNSLARNIRQEDSTHLEVRLNKNEIRLNKNEICEEDSDHNLAKSGGGGSAKKTTQRGPTLRELLQLPADCGSPEGVVSQSKQLKHSKHQEQIKLEKQKAVSKQHKWCGILKTKGLSWSCLYNPEDTENKKPPSKNKKGVFDKVTNSEERTELLKASTHIG